MAVRQGTVENLVSGTGGGIGDTNLSPVPPIKKEIKRKQIYADTAIQRVTAMLFVWLFCAGGLWGDFRYCLFEKFF